MKGRVTPFLASVIVLFTLGALPPFLWANPPNIVLSQAIHFSTPSGEPVTLIPGKYVIEQAGPTQLRVTPEGDKEPLIIQAESLTHEQYELFSPMALTRPREQDEFSIELYLPGGIRLEAKGSSKEIPMAQRPTPMPSLSSTPSEQGTNQPLDPQTPAAVIPEPEPPAMADMPVPVEPPPTPPTQPPSLSSSQLIPYRALSPDRPGLRIDARNETPSPLPTILVLAPNHVGLTSQEHPILNWYLSQTTDDPLDVMISDESNLHVLLDVRLLPPLPAGIHQLLLEDYGIALVPGVSYRWTVRLMSTQSTGNLTASGVIQRTAPPPSSSFASSLSYSPEAYAKKGLWYDAFSALSGLLQGNPKNSKLIAQRTALLDQVGLSEVADFVQQPHTP